MQPDNKIKESLVIVSITLGVLLILSFIKFEYLFKNVNFTVRNIDLLYDIKTEPAEEPPVNEIKENLSEQKVNLASFGFIEIPSGILNFLQPKESGFDYSLPYQGAKTSITGNTKQLSYFFDALKNAKSKTVRIAHYGDSMIEGDLISSDIREALQNKFGGNGVGWLGIVSQDITFRLTTKHSYSTGNWETASVYTNNPKSLPIGISGEASVPKGNAWVKYETTTAKRYLKDKLKVKLSKLAVVSDLDRTTKEYTFSLKLS